MKLAQQIAPLLEILGDEEDAKSIAIVLVRQDGTQRTSHLGSHAGNQELIRAAQFLQQRLYYEWSYFLSKGPREPNLYERRKTAEAAGDKNAVDEIDALAIAKFREHEKLKSMDDALKFVGPQE